MKNPIRSPVFLVTLWLFNIAMENDPFIDGLSINSLVIFHVLNNQMVNPMKSHEITIAKSLKSLA